MICFILWCQLRNIKLAVKVCFSYENTTQNNIQLARLLNNILFILKCFTFSSHRKKRTYTQMFKCTRFLKIMFVQQAEDSNIKNFKWEMLLDPLFVQNMSSVKFGVTVACPRTSWYCSYRRQLQRGRDAQQASQYTWWCFVHPVPLIVTQMKLCLWLQYKIKGAFDG